MTVNAVNSYLFLIVHYYEGCYLNFVAEIMYCLGGVRDPIAQEECAAASATLTYTIASYDIKTLSCRDLSVINFIRFPPSFSNKHNINCVCLTVENKIIEFGRET